MIKKYYWIVIVWMGCFCSCSAQGEFGVDNQTADSRCKALTCVNEVDTAEQINLNRKGKRKLQIYLIRHAKPNLKKKWFYSAREAQQYIFDYNSVPIIPFKAKLVKVNLKPNHVIYCSNLPRSQETALKIFGDKYPVVADSVFREYEIRVVNAISLIKLPLGLWQAFSRGSWMLGFNHRGIESRKEARFRTQKAAENLIKVAEQEETAILVAHGMLNSGIEKELKKQGWQVVQKKGQVNLGATILVKIVEL